MTQFKHECCDCATGAYPCQGSSCTQGTMHYYCDACGEETEQLYQFDGEELCADCVLEKLPRVE